MQSKWISVKDKLPQVDEPCWYYFELLGMFRGAYDGLYVDDDGKEWPGMSIFYSDDGFLTGDVTHWHPDQEEVPNEPV
jgi:hypothetical protein